MAMEDRRGTRSKGLGASGDSSSTSSFGLDTGTPCSPLNDVSLRELVSNVEDIRKNATDSEKRHMLPAYSSFMSRSSFESSSSLLTDGSSVVSSLPNRDLQRILLQQALEGIDLVRNRTKAPYDLRDLQTTRRLRKRIALPNAQVEWGSPIMEQSPRYYHRISKLKFGELSSPPSSAPVAGNGGKMSFGSLRSPEQSRSSLLRSFPMKHQLSASPKSQPRQGKLVRRDENFRLSSRRESPGSGLSLNSASDQADRLMEVDEAKVSPAVSGRVSKAGPPTESRLRIDVRSPCSNMTPSSRSQAFSSGRPPAPVLSGEIRGSMNSSSSSALRIRSTGTDARRSGSSPSVAKSSSAQRLLDVSGSKSSPSTSGHMAKSERRTESSLRIAVRSPVSIAVPATSDQSFSPEMEPAVTSPGRMRDSGLTNHSTASPAGSRHTGSPFSRKFSQAQVLLEPPNSSFNSSRVNKSGQMDDSRARTGIDAGNSDSRMNTSTDQSFSPEREPAVVISGKSRDSVISNRSTASRGTGTEISPSDSAVRTRPSNAQCLMDVDEPGQSGRVSEIVSPTDSRLRMDVRSPSMVYPPGRHSFSPDREPAPIADGKNTRDSVNSARSSQSRGIGTGSRPSGPSLTHSYRMRDSVNSHRSPAPRVTSSDSPRPGSISSAKSNRSQHLPDINRLKSSASSSGRVSKIGSPSESRLRIDVRSPVSRVISPSRDHSFSPDKEPQPIVTGKTRDSANSPRFSASRRTGTDFSRRDSAVRTEPSHAHSLMEVDEPRSPPSDIRRESKIGPSSESRHRTDVRSPEQGYPPRDQSFNPDKQPVPAVAGNTRDSVSSTRSTASRCTSTDTLRSGSSVSTNSSHAQRMRDKYGPKRSSVSENHRPSNSRVASGGRVDVSSSKTPGFHDNSMPHRSGTAAGSSRADRDLVIGPGGSPDSYYSDDNSSDESIVAEEGDDPRNSLTPDGDRTVVRHSSVSHLSVADHFRVRHHYSVDLDESSPEALLVGQDNQITDDEDGENQFDGVLQHDQTVSNESIPVMDLSDLAVRVPMASVLDDLKAQPEWYANISLLSKLVKEEVVKQKLIKKSSAETVASKQFVKFRDICIRIGLQLTSPDRDQVEQNQKNLKHLNVSSVASFYHLCRDYVPKEEFRDDTCPLAYFALLQKLFFFFRPILRRLVPISVAGCTVQNQDQ